MMLLDLQFILFFISISKNYNYNNIYLSNLECKLPTDNNPFINYTIGDLIEKKFRKNIYSDLS